MAPLTFLVGRFSVATLVLLSIGLVARTGRPDPRAALIAFLLGAFVYAAQATTLTLAVEHIDASLAAIIFGTYPAIVLIALLAHRGRAAVSVWQSAALIGVLIGVAMLVGGSTGPLDPTGIALAFGSAAFFAMFLLAADAIGSRIDAIPFATLACAGACITLVGAGLATGSPLLPSDGAGWTTIAAAGAISTALAFVAMFLALRALATATVAIILGGEPLATVLLSAVFLGERLEPVQVAGALLVVCTAAALGGANASRKRQVTVV
jgi:drug/metabolite transporter (DMT)-like permease